MSVDATPMTAPEQDRRPTSSAADGPLRNAPDRGGPTYGQWALQVAYVLLVYVLSIGPLYWQWYGSRFAGESPLLRAFYEPLIFLAQSFPLFGEWLDWYVGLWIT